MSIILEVELNEPEDVTHEAEQHQGALSLTACSTRTSSKERSAFRLTKTTATSQPNTVRFCTI